MGAFERAVRLQAQMTKIDVVKNVEAEKRQRLIYYIEGHCGSFTNMPWTRVTTPDLGQLSDGIALLVFDKEMRD